MCSSNYTIGFNLLTIMFPIKHAWKSKANAKYELNQMNNELDTSYMQVSRYKLMGQHPNMVNQVVHCKIT